MSLYIFTCFSADVHKARATCHKTSRSTSSNSSKISGSAIRNIVDRLSLEKHCNSTEATYYRVWKLFNQFFLCLDSKPCEWEDRLVLFTGFLVENKLKSSTVKSYISAIKSVLQQLGEKISENNYLLKSLTQACRLRNNTIVNRLPISRQVLRLILNSLLKLFENPALSAELVFFTVLCIILLIAKDLGGSKKPSCAFGKECSHWAEQK